MAVQQTRPSGGSTPAALVSLLTGIAALTAVILSILFIRQNPDMAPHALIPVSGATSTPNPVPGILLAGVMICFLLGLIGMIAGTSAFPKPGEGYRTKTCKWMCRIGTGFSMFAMFIDMLIISFLRVFAFVP